MSKKSIPFIYDMVGSFLRPAALKQARKDFKAGKITREALTQVENEEITKLVAKEKAAGYHAITDGEFRRSYWHLDFMWGLNGIKEIELDHGYFFHGEETTPGSIEVTGKISGENHPFVEHFKFMKQFEDENTIVKQTNCTRQAAATFSLTTAPGVCSATPITGTPASMTMYHWKAKQKSICASTISRWKANRQI